MHSFDRRTDRQTDRDRQTDFSSLDRVCIPCSAVILWAELFSVLSQPTYLTYGTDRRTDIQTERRADSFLVARPVKLKTQSNPI